MLENTMSDRALKSEQNMVVNHIPVNKIYADENFNCRLGPVTPMDVVDLARSIAKDGLQNPITVQPRLATTPEGYDYVIVCGHRRHMAYKVNGAETIPCFISSGLNYFQAKTINAIENLKRKDLNMLEEALTISHYKNAGWTQQMVATEIGVSTGWVQTRYMILDLPIEVQREIANGIFSVVQIRELYNIRDKSKVIEVASIMKDSKLRTGRIMSADQILRPKPKATARKRRNPPEIVEMIQTIFNVFGQYNLATAALGWAAGNVSNFDMFKSIKEYAAQEGIVWEIPEMSL